MNKLLYYDWHLGSTIDSENFEKSQPIVLYYIPSLFMVHFLNQITLND
jgi:hypothetical protein